MKKILFAGILAIGLLLLGCTSSGPSGQSGNQSGGMMAGGSANYQRCVSQCSEASAGSGPNCKDGCMIQEAEDTKDTSWCDNLVNKQARPSCYGTVAKSAGDIKICDRLTDPTEKNYCIGTFGGPSTG
jgi:hypothetical protein